MSAILYGNLSAEIVSGLGTRIERVTLRQAATDLFQPQRPRALPRLSARWRRSQAPSRSQPPCGAADPIAAICDG